MLPGTIFGQTAVLTATGLTCITSANAHIIGIFINSTATGQVKIWAGVTATATSSGAAISVNIGKATATGLAQYFPYPAYASGGITVQVVGSLDPSVTLFWNPAGGA